MTKSNLPNLDGVLGLGELLLAGGNMQERHVSVVPERRIFLVAKIKARSVNRHAGEQGSEQITTKNNSPRIMMLKSDLMKKKVKRKACISRMHAMRSLFFYCLNMCWFFGATYSVKITASSNKRALFLCSPVHLTSSRGESN